MRSGVVAASRRAEIEAEIERLIAYLDIADGDADLEPYFAGSSSEDDERETCDDTEPSLGSTSDANQLRGWRSRPSSFRFAYAVEDGEEGDDTGIGDRDGIDPEGEPWLGWTDWGFIGSTNDAEPNGDEGDHSGCW